ncbi:MAG TPA: hypothetical protein VGH28_30265 [Polyangiaceae bacterium]|jgi:hypothetical protein
MADQRLKDLRGKSRRDFLRWSATLAAVLGLERSRYLNVLGDSAGVALADQAACPTTMRSIHLIAGNGGLAWFTQLFPQTDVAMNGGANSAFYALGKAKKASGTDKPLVYAPDSPFQTLSPTKQVSAFMAGNNETHTSTPQSAATIATGTGMIAAIAAIQQANPTLLPVIGMNPITFGTAPGAPGVATVANSAGLVDLFNSAASRTLLQTPAASALNDSYYRTFLSLNAASARATLTTPQNVGKTAANLLGKNLSSELTPSAADLTRYGLTGVPTTISEIGKAMCTAVKAFKLGLTSSVIIPAMRDDPHGAFNDMAQLQTNVTALGKIFDAFMADCAGIPDPSGCGQNLDKGVVFTIHGDTPKDPTNRNGWPDGTPNNSNWLYVFGNGFLKTGWFGNVSAARVATGFDPTTGNDVAGQGSGVTAAPAAAAAAYAVAKGDMRRVQDFYRGPALDGIINAQQM